MAHILLAEDDVAMCTFLAKALELVGHNVTITHDGLAALAALEKPGAAYDLLLTDVVMPGIDGIELSQRAVVMRPGLKIMFITGFAAVTLESRSDAVRNAKILAKPFHLNDLVEQVKAVLLAG